MQTTRAPLLVLALGAALMTATPCRGGPNAGGVIILHCNEAVEFTSPSYDYCGQAALAGCSEADSRVDRTTPAVFFALAAFPDTSSPRLVGISFGISYSAHLNLVGWGFCADSAVEDSAWPQSGTGATVFWLEPQTDLLKEFYWFAAYDYSAVPAQFGLAANPSEGGWFGSDQSWGGFDAIAGYGSLGFFMDGHNPCEVHPGGVPAEKTTWGRLKSTYRGP